VHVAITVVITNQRLIIAKGIIGRNQRIVERGRIQNADITQGPMGRRLDCGGVVIETAGGTVAVRVRTFAHPRVIRDAVPAIPA
jgi:membrane protein YdbS with pleckstrin-like domain